MSNVYAKQAAKKAPQSEALPGQVPNSAGGHAYAVGDWQRLRRFLVLGTEGGTYYAAERALALENAAVVERCLAEDGVRTVLEIVTISDEALAPKNDPAIFALALASVKGDEKTRKEALNNLNRVCRTGTHLFQFAACREALGGGWGRAMRRAVGAWYLEKSVDRLVHSVLKYQQRDGWSQRDLLRLAHPSARFVGSPDCGAEFKTAIDQRNAVFDAVCAPMGGQRTAPSKALLKPAVGFGAAVPVIRETQVRGTGGGWARVAEFSKLAEGWLRAKAYAAEGCSDEAMALVVAEYRLERELVPSEYLNRAMVQEAMLPALGFTALVRNLANMSRSGYLAPMSAGEGQVLKRLGDHALLRKSRVHPFALMLAARTYAAGHGFRSQGAAWTVCPRVVEALDEAFEGSFANVEPTGKRWLLGLDVSGSMGMELNGGPVTAAEATAAMSLVTYRTEPGCHVLGFATQVKELGYGPKTDLARAMQITSGHNFGGTDTAAAIRWALDRKVEVDVFGVYTDSETWAGDQHTCKALQEYRKKTGIQAKLAVVAFASNGISVGRQDDPLSMDFAGLDASLPQALAAFAQE